MKDRQTAPLMRPYTASEVVEILKEAKRLGVISLKLAGFEAGFNVQGSRAAHEHDDVPRCIQCKAEVSEDWMKWCSNCYRNQTQTSDRRNDRR